MTARSLLFGGHLNSLLVIMQKQLIYSYEQANKLK